jgi:hypothetical protein
MKSKSYWKIGFIFISVILILLVGFLAYLFGKGDINLNTNLKNNSTATEEPIVSPTPNISSEIEAIKKAVYKKTGLTSENADVTVSQYTSTFAKGGVKEKEAVGGAYFIAAKVNSEWICVYDGQSQPTCEQIEPFNFPKEMVPECLDENNKVVKR